MKTQSPFFIRLTTPDELDSSVVRKWYHTCKSKLPSGVLGSVQVNKPNFGIANVQLIHRKTNEQHEYEIPLNRDLLPREIEPVKQAWNLISDQGTFDITSSASQANSRHKLADAVELEPSSYDTLCETLAKHQHGRWCRQRQSAGWKYGLAMDPKEKTHPLLRPWEDLPESYREIDREAPRVFARVLDEMGYTIVKKKK